MREKEISSRCSKLGFSVDSDYIVVLRKGRAKALSVSISCPWRFSRVFYQKHFMLYLRRRSNRRLTLYWSIQEQRLRQCGENATIEIGLTVC
jgi:hypothetical protein